MRTYTAGRFAELGALGERARSGEEQFETLVQSRTVRVERIVSRGHCSAEGFWYDQGEDEFVLLVSGAARLRFDDGSLRELRPGDWVNIPAHVRHRVDWTDETMFTVWLAVFSASAGSDG